MKRILAILLIAPVLALAAPSTPISRGRLATDLDGAGHSITNSPMATTNFVWEAVASVTNAPWGASGLTTNDVRAIVAAATNAIPRGIAVEGAPATNLVSSGTVYWISDEYGASPVVDGSNVLVPFSNIENVPDFAVRTNLPPVSASATIGELVGSINAVINAMRKEDE